MYCVEVHSTLPPRYRQDIDTLIFSTWAHEELTSHDVVLRVERGMSVLDPLDSQSSHVLLFEGQKLVAYGRVSFFQSNVSKNISEVPRAGIQDKSYAYLSRLVVDPKSRNRGISGLMDGIRIQLAERAGVTSIFGWAVGEVRQKSLRHFGFDALNERDFFQTGWYRANRKTKLMALTLPNANQTKWVAAIGDRFGIDIPQIDASEATSLVLS